MTDAAFASAIERIKQGDRSGLREIYDAYGSMVYRVFLGRVHRHQDAEDLTSEFFLKLWNSASYYRAGTGHKSWMTTIARNMAIDFQRRNREVPVEDVAEEYAQQLTSTDNTEDTVLGSIRSTQILSHLSEDEREIVQLHLAADLPFREITAILQRPLGTIAWKYRTAIGKLQKLAKEGQLV